MPKAWTYRMILSAVLLEFRSPSCSLLSFFLKYFLQDLKGVLTPSSIKSSKEIHTTTAWDQSIVFDLKQPVTWENETAFSNDSSHSVLKKCRKVSTHIILSVISRFLPLSQVLHPSKHRISKGSKRNTSTGFFCRGLPLQCSSESHAGLCLSSKEPFSFFCSTHTSEAHLNLFTSWEHATSS